MREKLAPLLNKRIRVRGTFQGYRKFTRGGYSVTRALFTGIVGSDNPEVELTDHLWVIMGAQIHKLNPIPGDPVEFTGTVALYMKGYHDEREADYRLSRQRDFRKLAKSFPIGDDDGSKQGAVLALLNEPMNP